MTTVHETHRIPPPAGVAAELLLPLSFFDFMWLHFHPTRRLIFYDHPCSAADFFAAIVPRLKRSLSLTLKYYLPVAANLLYPLDTEQRPLIRYASGDSVPLTVAVSRIDFDELTVSHARDSDQFYDFMPEMPELREEGVYQIVPLIALQATLFPNRGICIGLSNHHCLGDARSIVRFIWAWAQINKSDGDEEFVSENGKDFPFFDRSVFGEDSRRINDKFWDARKNIPLKPSSSTVPTDRVRSSFTLHKSDIINLKNLLLSKKPYLIQISTFVVTASYIWTCFLKSGDAVGEEVDQSQHTVFGFPADGRGRPNAMVDPPVPLNYFGNCLGFGLTAVEHQKLTAEDGFVIAAEAIAGEIENRVRNKKAFLYFSDDSQSDRSKLKGLRRFAVTGSPKFDLSDADFGWGKAMSVEVLSIDEEEYSMSLRNSSDSDGGLVVGLSLPRERMEAFTAIFSDGLKS